MERVNATILSRTGSEVTMIPEVANHLISSGGKRLRPMLTLAMASLTGYSGDGHIKLAASVEFMHTATLLHDDVVDESELRRGKDQAHRGDELLLAEGEQIVPVVLAIHTARACQRRGEVGARRRVVEDDRSGLASEFQAHPLELFTAQRGDASSG